MRTPTRLSARLFGALLVTGGGCLEVEFGPEIAPIVVNPDEDPACRPTPTTTFDPCQVLRIVPNEVAEGDRVEIAVTFSFEDQEGDVIEARLVLTDPLGERHAIACGLDEGPCTIELSRDAAEDSLQGFGEGTMTLRFDFSADALGPHEIEVWLVDASGFESNRLHNTFTVLAPERE